MSATLFVLVVIAGLIGFCCTLVLGGAFLGAVAKDAKELVEARCERMDAEARCAECEEREALARGLGLLPDPLESWYAAPAYDKERVR